VDFFEREGFLKGGVNYAREWTIKKRKRKKGKFIMVRKDSWNCERLAIAQRKTDKEPATHIFLPSEPKE